MRKTIRPLLEPLESRLVLDVGPLVISEFMAINDRTLADSDGDYPDWIEIHNPSAAAVDLDGWHLTDNRDNLTKWRFPAVTLAPDEYLVVFASQKDRTDPAVELHSNFKLSGGGEYLALVLPDGVTAASEFAPEYPQQFEDVSYGPTSQPGSFSAIDGAELTYRVPDAADAALGTGWTDPVFDDSAWTRGGIAASGLLITEAETGSPDFVEIQNVGPAMLDTSGWVVAVNNANDVSQPADVSARHATLWELPATIAPGEVLYRSDDPGDAGHYWGEDIFWRTGRLGWVMVVDDAGNLADFVVWGYDPAQIASMSVEVGGHQVTPGEAWAGPAVMPEGDWHPLQRHGSSDHDNASDWAFIRAPSQGLQNVDLEVPFGVDLSNGIGFDVDSAGLDAAIRIDVQQDMHGVSGTLWTRMPFQVGTLAGLNRILLRMQYNDGFVAYLNGREVARRNAPDLPQWDSTATAARSVEDSLAVEQIDVTEFLDVLEVGTNVLAIQGMNVGAGDGTFLVLPGLAGSGTHYFIEPTPGEENAAGLAALGPIIRELTEDPPPPAGNQDLTITAEVAPAFYAVDHVTLHYRVNFDAQRELPMTDDGTGADSIAADDIFTGVIPHAGYGPGDMVRWYVTAVDASAAGSRRPAFLDSQGQNQSPEYHGTVVVDPTLSSGLPIFHWYAVNPSAGHTRGGTRASVFYEGRFYDNVFARRRGQATNAYSQKFDFNKSYGLYVNEEIGRVGEFNLNAQGSDPAYVRQTLAFQTYPAGGNAASGSFMMLVRVNGGFDRVGAFIEQVDEDFLKRYGFDPQGALYKFVQRSNLNPVFSDTTTGIEKKTRLGEGFSDIQAVVDGLNLPTAEARRRFVFDGFNVPQLLNSLALRSVTQDADDVRKNFYLYRDTEGNGEWSIFPWDKDWTFGVSGDGGPHLSHPFFGDYDHRKPNANQWNVLYEVIFNEPVTREMFLRRLRTVMDLVLQPPETPAGERLYEPWVNELLAGVTPHVSISGSTINALKNFFPARRQKLYVDHSIDNWTPGSDVAGIPHRQIGSPPIGFGSFEYSPASGNQDQEFIELVNANPTAVDVSGWRLTEAVEHVFLPGTVIPAGGSLYVSPEVAAFRARSTGPRGGQGLFVQGDYRGHLSSFGETVRLLDAGGQEIDSLSYPGNPSRAQRFLRVTEVMYNPHQPRPEEIAAGFADHDEFEYIELINTDTAPLTAEDLDGVHFTQGVTFTFQGVTLQPGGRGLVVQNRDAFEARYGDGHNVAGEFASGRLDNGGERLKLEDASGGTVVEFVYNDRGEWPQEADGTAASLEVLDTAGDYTEGANWQYGTTYGGTPGSGPEPRLGVVINEVLTHTDPPHKDAIELHNATAGDVDIGGWYLSDDWGWDPTGVSGNYKKYRIPTGTIIPAGGYVVFDEDDFNPTWNDPLPDPGPNDFALNGAHGDDVWLLKADAAGELTHFGDHLAFPAAAEGESFGRWPNGSGGRYPMLTPTIDKQRPNGGANSTPRVGPVVISEVHYNPRLFDEDSELEFIELYNNTAEAIDLAEWRLRGGIEFDFAAGATLPPYSPLVVLPFPLQSAARWSAFCAEYGLDAGQTDGFTGGYRGQLGNGGERVQLQRPDRPPPDEPGFVPRLLEDEVRYDDRPDWPTEADGHGSSLQRTDTGAWGHAPQSWTALPPTPGTTVFLVPDDAEVVGRRVFYNDSAFDDNNPAAGAGDDAAIAPDKQALLPGQTATKANYTSFSRGLTGIMVDVARWQQGAAPKPDDFQFRVGNSDVPDDWAAAPGPSRITVRPGQGVDGSDRVTIIWPDGAIQKQWLQVKVLATGHTRLPQQDVFYFGNAIGESGNSATDAKVGAVDMLGARDNQRNFLNPAPIDFAYDFNRDARVNTIDMLIARNNQTHFLNALKLITVPGGKAAAAEKFSLSDAVFLPGNLDWLYQIEPSSSQGRTSTIPSGGAQQRRLDVLAAKVND